MSEEKKEKEIEITDEIKTEVEPQQERIKFRHPQQVLTNKEIQILLLQKEEDMTEEEKGALKLYFLRLGCHNSKPKILSSKENKRRKARRALAKQSRKNNRAR